MARSVGFWVTVIGMTVAFLIGLGAFAEPFLEGHLEACDRSMPMVEGAESHSRYVPVRVAGGMGHHSFRHCGDERIAAQSSRQVHFADVRELDGPYRQEVAQAQVDATLALASGCHEGTAV